MAHVGNKGFFILDADAAPTFNPTTSFVGGIASVAGTQIIYFHQTGTTWQRVDIGALSGADGNNTVIVRANATTGVLPTPAEVPAAELDAGDTATVYLNNGTIEYNVYDGTNWTLAFTTTAQTLSNALVTLSGVPASSTDLGTFTGTTIPDNVTIKVALQTLETVIEALQVKSVADTATVDTTVTALGVLTMDVKLSATQDNEFEITASADGLRITKQVLGLYASHALADADAGLLAGGAYTLTITNLEGVPSDGTKQGIR